MKVLYKGCWLILRVYLRLLCKLEIKGIENVPKSGGVIIAANHIGAGDPPFIGTCVKREFHYLAKKELFKNFFIGKFLRRINAIPVNRSILDQRALRTAEDVLRQGQGLILFPEGTRSRSGELKKGKPGVGLLARQTQTLIVPAYIENSRGFATLIFSKRRLKVRFGKPLDVDWVTSFTDDKDGYRAITEELMKRIDGLRSEGKDEIQSTIKDQSSH
ncbi:MAG TPA: 1-acyl-sn-glycerol-3-phosphate acyltransferase [candidate division Zixibacteria bacterium]|nr:1-acyl-sn-glycerol-3-phosphate acyltransferase [candidate division Zixibacteria bacterium]HBZ00186.1 1-acyl-sn-glycerol-3-phosphate acyltransferase [candidate division Zixibacteria bacterium]